LTVIKDNDATCNGSCDGAAVALTNGGTWPFSFVWSNGAASPGTNTLCAGIAVVTVTDANSCQATGQAVIGQPDVLQASVSSQSPASCAGVADGSAALAATGGTSPYTYSWSGGGTGATRADLAAGSYTVSLTDSESCEDIITVTITEPAPIALAINGQADALCAGSADGTADVSASGGTSPYTYTWSDGGTGASRNDLAAGTYTVTAADANSCQIDIAVIIGEPAGGVTASISVEEDVLCFGGTEGELLASASGGTAPYTFAWSDGGTGASRAGLAAGSYTVTAADANGCEATAAESLAEPGLLTLTVIKDNDATCNGSCDGAAVALTNGGTWPFSFVWSNGAASPGTNTLCAGIAVVTVTDANSCQATGQAVIGQPDVLQASVSSQSPASCAGVADGSAALAATGGTSPYTYSWSGGGTGATRADLAAGSYTVSLTDSESCEDIITVTITEPAPIALAITRPGRCSLRRFCRRYC
jgi:hypothetical protein